MALKQARKKTLVSSSEERSFISHLLGDANAMGDYLFPL